jgi:hypothetical protein
MTTEPAAAVDLDIKGTTYVFCPNEPELQVYVMGGRLVHFSNGRLDTDRTPLSADEIAWFEQVAQDDVKAQRPPRYIVTQNIHDPMLRSMLLDRFMQMAAGRSYATDVQRIMEEARYMTGVALSDGDGPADTKMEPMPLSALSRQHPNLAATAKSIIGTEAEAGIEVDQATLDRETEVINAAAAGSLDPDTVRAMARTEDSTLPPEGFTPPTEQEELEARQRATQSDNPFARE